ncbi:GPN-loop GTPase 3 [Cladophialophora carrionii]|uniref:GPN-loop GTPase 3 n=1 Tax=Cladophialophora carrionii TaxID=86049 RepID=A0A1C1C978_9EURO|nr:GPN-loop GTPase 3 [Cladophialophora carrionii]
MSKFGVLVTGPAGAGKTTFCTSLITHLQHTRRSSFYVNLDPAATSFAYTPDLDIRDLISLEDVMEEPMSLGPNGGLIYCFEFLLQNLDWLSEAIDPLTEEYLIIFDLPGQIELYTHIPLLPELVRYLSRMGPLNINLCAAYLLEATFVVDKAKFFAGTLSAMSAMIMLELPHVNILSKMDLVKDQVPKRELRRFIDPDAQLIDDDDTARYPLLPSAGGGAASEYTALDVGNAHQIDNVMSGGSFKALNRAVAKLIDDFSMVSFLQLDVNDEESVGDVLSYIDDAIQFHEAQEPRDPKEPELQEPAWEND